MNKKTKNKHCSFGEIYNLYYNKVYIFFKKRIINQSDAEDLTSDVFLSLYKNFNKYDENKASVSTWIYAIAGNRLKNYYRDNKKEISLSDNDSYIELAHNYDYDSVMELDNMKKSINSAIEILSEREKQIIIMKYFLDLNSTEISKRLNLTSVNIRVILMRALKKVNHYFKNNNINWEE